MAEEKIGGGFLDGTIFAVRHLLSDGD